MTALLLPVITAGEAYTTRYRLHAMSGQELSTIRSCPSFSFGGALARSAWLGGGSSCVPGPGEYNLSSWDRKMWVRPAPVFGKEKQRPLAMFEGMVEAMLKPGPLEYCPVSVVNMCVCVCARTFAGCKEPRSYGAHTHCEKMAPVASSVRRNALLALSPFRPCASARFAPCIRRRKWRVCSTMHRCINKPKIMPFSW